MNGKQKIIGEELEENYIIKHVNGSSNNADKFHFHDHYEIYFSLSGNTKCFINDKICEIQFGDILFFKPTDFHKIVMSSDSQYERYYILFNPAYINEFSTNKTNLMECFSSKHDDSLPVIHLDKGFEKKFIKLLEKTMFFSSSSEFGSDIYKKIALAEILIFINKHYSTNNNSQYTECCVSISSYNKVSPVIEHIDNHLNDNLSLDFLAGKFYISKYYMETLFKTTTGLTINEYIITKRILKAKHLLKSNIPVTTVSEMVGFNSYSHFIRTFTKLVHISPKQYAKKSKAIEF